MIPTNQSADDCRISQPVSRQIDIFDIINIGFWKLISNQFNLIQKSVGKITLQKKISDKTLQSFK